MCVRDMRGVLQECEEGPPHDIVTAELQHTTQSVADDGGTQVTHVHFFSDIGRREIHQNLLTRHGRGCHACSSGEG